MLAGNARLAGLDGTNGTSLSALISCKRFVRCVGEWSNLAGYICRCALSRSSGFAFDGFSALCAVLLLRNLLVKVKVNDRYRQLTERPPRPARPPRPRPRPRPRVDERRRVSPLAPSAPLPDPSCASGLRASWMETLRSRMALPFSSWMARSASLEVERSTKA